MKIKYLLLSALFPLLCTGQNYVNQTGGLLTVKVDPVAYDVEGTPYLTETYESARVNNGTKSFPIRYNALKDVMEYDNKGLILELIKDKNAIVVFDENKEKFVLKDYTTKNEEVVNGYLKQLGNTGQWGLYERVRKFIQKPVASDNGYNSTNTKEKFVLLDKEYYLQNDSGIYYIKKPEHLYKKLFKTHKSSIKKYISENKPDFTDVRSVQKLLLFLDKNVK